MLLWARLVAVSSGPPWPRRTHQGVLWRHAHLHVGVKLWKSTMIFAAFDANSKKTNKFLAPEHPCFYREDTQPARRCVVRQLRRPSLTHCPKFDSYLTVWNRSPQVQTRLRKVNVISAVSYLKEPQSAAPDANEDRVVLAKLLLCC